jgi:DNA polymerase-1
VLAPVWKHPLVAHSAVFEFKFLAAVGIKPRLQCTEQAVKLLAGVPEGGIWALADACQTYLGIAVPKDLQISAWAAPDLSPGQLAYAAADAVLCGRLWAKIAPELKATNRDAAYRLQRDSLPVAAAMELRGIGIDLDAHAKLCESWRASREAAAGAWSETTGRPLPEKASEIAAYLADVLDESALSNWPRTKTGMLSTETAQLEKVRQLPGIASLLRIKETDKLLKAFAEPLRKLVNPVTGRLHPHFKVAAAKSGRWSANGPNIQQLPHDKATRSIIVAAPGHVLVSADYSQMELRAAAWISCDPELTRVYEQGLDVHKLTAAAIAGVPVEAVTKEQRTAAKAANFGLIYGSGPAGLVASAWADYGVQLTEDEAATIRTGSSPSTAPSDSG